jgi:LysM repeat protein
MVDEPQIDELSDDAKQMKMRIEELYTPQYNERPKKDKNLRMYVGIGAAFLLIILIIVFWGVHRNDSPEQWNRVIDKLSSLEERLANLEKQQEQQGKRIEGSDAVLVKQIESLSSLSSRVETIEKHRTESRVSARPTSNAATKQTPAPSSAGKRYHDVKGGETLYSISKKYGISVNELRGLNKLGPNQTIEPGQKLLVSRNKP